MDFRILGPFEVWEARRLVEIPAPKQRAVLAVLVLNAGHVVSADRLLELVWGDEQPDGGVKTLWYHISKLRDRLEPDRAEGDGGVIVTRASGYLLEAAPNQVDAAAFERLVEEAHQLLPSDPGRATSLIDEALQLWRGPALLDFAYEEFAQPEIIRLDELRLRAVEERIDAQLALGAHRELIGELTALTEEHPLHERYWGQLMVALSRSGRQAEALDAYQVLRKRLGEDLGIEPSDELRALEERVLLQDPELLAPGPVPSLERLRGYVLRERLGEGDHGVVWRATQPGVGRDVAIKAIRSDLANQPEFVREFEREAQVVAAMEHPHVVSLFDFWRDPDGAYLVMPFLQGGSLKQALQDGRLPPATALSVVTAIGEALGFVHRHGMVHQDVTPGNVLFDSEGNAYLADLGVAVLAGAAGNAVTSSPAYMAPEQLAESAATERSDIFSLGVLTFAALTGTDPAPGSPLPSLADPDADLSVNVDDVIGRATAPQPDDRFADVNGFLLALGEALGSAREAVMSAAEVRNPYKGLRAFQEPDAGDFFGREAIVAELVSTMATHRLLGVVGPSGCGKSSLVRAGLIPAIRAEALPSSDRWIITDMYPGNRPLAELEGALLRVAVEEPPDDLVDLLCAGNTERNAVVDSLLPAGSELAVIVDQFEELFTLTSHERERRRFLDLLAAWGRDPRSRVRVIVTLRADFYDRPLEYPEFGDLLRRGVVSITMPPATNLAQAVAGPAQQVGITLEPGLENEIVRDVSDQPGGLPLMQFALTELFSDRSGTQLTAAAYQRTGGVLGSLGRRAEELYTYHDEAGRATVRQVFLRLVTVDEGMADTRRRIPIAELQALDIDPESLDVVLADYGSHRLLTFDRDPESRAPTVEVAHEALLTRWDRLHNWIADRRDDLVLHRRLAASVAEWRAAGKVDAYLVSGGRLDHYEQFAAATDIGLTEEELHYLAQSRRQEDERQRRRSRTRRAVMGVLTIAAIIAGVLAVVAYANQQRAEDATAVAESATEDAVVSQRQAEDAEEDALASQREADAAKVEEEGQARLARSRELSAAAINVLDHDPELSLLLALEAVKVTEPVFESTNALHEAVLAQRVTETFDLEDEAAIAPDGSSIITAEESVNSWSTATGEHRWGHQLPEHQTGSGYFTTDGSQFVVYAVSEEPPFSQALHWFDVETGTVESYDIDWPCDLIHIIPDGHGQVHADRPLLAEGPPLVDGECGHGGVLLAIEGGEARELRRWDPAELSSGQWTTSGDGRFLALGIRERSTVVDLETDETRVFGPPAQYGSGNALNSDGSQLLTVGATRNDLWDLDRDVRLWQFPSRRLQQDAWFSVDGSAVITNDGLWDVNNGQLLVDVPGSGGRATLSDDGDLLLTSGASTRLLNGRGQGEVGVVLLPQGVGFARQTLELAGLRGAVMTSAGATAVFDMESGAEVATIDGTSGWGIAMSSDGRLLAAQKVEGEILGTVRVHDLATGEPLVAMEGLCNWSNHTGDGPGCRDYPDVPFSGFVEELEFTSDGTVLVAKVRDVVRQDLDSLPLVVAWDVATGALVFDSDAAVEGDVTLLSPDGDHTFRYHDGLYVVVDSVTESETTTARLDGPKRRVSSDGLYVVEVLDSGEFAVEHNPDPAVIGPPLVQTVRAVGREGDEILDFEVNPSGTTLVVARQSGAVEIREFPSLVLNQEIRFGEPVLNVEFIHDTHILVIPDSGPGIVVTTDVNELLDIAGRRRTRDFTPEECDTYHIEPCPSLPEP